MKQHIDTLQVVVALHRLYSRYALLGLSSLQILHLNWCVCNFNGLAHASAEPNNATTKRFSTFSKCLWLQLGIADEWLGGRFQIVCKTTGLTVKLVSCGFVQITETVFSRVLLRKFIFGLKSIQLTGECSSQISKNSWSIHILGKNV